jgi:multisubunit Na+/H+ antiporter MnhG subunit
LKFIALIVFVVVQVVFISLALIGVVLMGDFYFMGQKHKKGPMGVVAEICL